MDQFMEKWHNDNKFRAKIKLLLYGIFIIIVTIYAISLNKQDEASNQIDDEAETNVYALAIPEQYNYQIDITIDDKTYQYNGIKTSDNMTINKISDGITTNYVYENNEYYVKDNDLFVKTTKDEVYDIINYNYISFDSIREYLAKATKNGNQYLVYLKDIILGNDSDEYFVMLISDNDISIDYTPLMKQLDSNLEKYNVAIHIEKIE